MLRRISSVFSECEDSDREEVVGFEGWSSEMEKKRGF